MSYAFFNEKDQLTWINEEIESKFSADIFH